MLSLAQSLTLSDFHQMYAIERAYYDPGYITPPQEAFRWYQAYPLSTLGESPRLAFLMRLNPMTAPIEIFRTATLGTGSAEVGMFVYSLVFTAVALVLGVVLFSRIEKTFMDTV